MSYMDAISAPSASSGNAMNEIKSMDSLSGKVSKPRVILLMNVNIGDGREQNIKVREGDVPEELAVQFCTENRLAEQYGDEVVAEVAVALADQIRSEVAALPTR